VAEAIDHLYMDDLLNSCQMLATANKLAIQIDQVLKSADFHLCSWRSNKKGFSFLNAEGKVADTASVLGMVWDLQGDMLQHAVPPDLDKVVHTKHGLLGAVASLFSPLRLAAPFLVAAKIKIKFLHTISANWDEGLSLVPVSCASKIKSVGKEDDGVPRVGKTFCFDQERQFWQSWLAAVPALCSIRFQRLLFHNVT
jgi:hypothetical protein